MNTVNTIYLLNTNQFEISRHYNNTASNFYSEISDNMNVIDGPMEFVLIASAICGTLLIINIP